MGERLLIEGPGVATHFFWSGQGRPLFIPGEGGHSRPRPPAETAARAAPADMGARQWQVAHPRQVGWFDSDNAHFCLDVDTGDDLERFQRLTGRSLAWPPGLSAGPPGR